jgi:hypothetical protein
VTSAFHFARKFTLAASAVAGLTTRLDLARLADKAIEGVDVLVVKAATFRAVVAASAATTTTAAHTAFIIAITIATIRAITTITTTKSATAKSTCTATTKPTRAATATFVVFHDLPHYLVVP